MTFLTLSGPNAAGDNRNRLGSGQSNLVYRSTGLWLFFSHFGKIKLFCSCGGYMWGKTVVGLGRRTVARFILPSWLGHDDHAGQRPVHHNSSWRNVCPGFAWSAVLTSGLYRFAGRTLRRPTSITFLLHSTSPLQSSQTDQHNWCCVKTFLPAIFLFLFPPLTIFFSLLLIFDIGASVRLTQ